MKKIIRLILVLVALPGTRCATAEPVGDMPDAEKAFVKDLQLAADYAKAHLQDAPPQETPQVYEAVDRLLNAPVDLLKKHKDEVHAIGWVNPGTLYMMLLKAGTTQDQRDLLRKKSGVRNVHLAMYGSDRDVEIFLKEVKDELDEKRKADYARSIKSFNDLSQMDLTNKTVAAFFQTCLNSPDTYKYANGGRVSLAWLACYAYASHHDADLSRQLLVHGRLINADDPQAVKEHKTFMATIEKYFRDKYGWEVSFRAPYMIAGYVREL